MTSRRGSNAYEGKTRTKREASVSLDQARHYRLVRSADRIELMCPKEGEKKEDTVDLSYLLAFPHLSEPFAQAIREICKSKASTYATCFKKGRELEFGFFAFLEEKALKNIRLEQLTTSHIEGFKSWLDQADKTGLAIYALQTRQHRMSHLRQVTEYLKQSDKWAPQLASDLSVRPGMWAGQGRGRKPTPIIQEEDYRKIYQACKKEIIEITGRVNAMRATLQANLHHPVALALEPAKKTVCGKGVARNLRNQYNDLGVLLATLHRRYPRQILTQEWLKSINDRSLAEAAIRRGGTSAISACFYPSARDLVPVVLMMAIHLDYNKATLMGSKVSDYRIVTGKLGRPEFLASASLIEEEDAADSVEEKEGEKLFMGAPIKKRARYRPQERILPVEDAPDNPAFLWQFLVEWTSWFRPTSAPEWQDRLFLYVTGSTSPNKRMQGFDGTTNPGGDCNFNYAYKAFFREHGLTYYTFRQFRPTGLDIVDVEFGGDIRAKQAAAGHAEVQTTYQSYTTDAQMQRGDEALAQASATRERFRKTQGKSDPRRKPVGADMGAATPGWTCSDPYDSPLYEKDRLCGGYGRCSACPLGSMSPNDCYSAAQAFNLLDAIDKAGETMAPTAWLERYGPSRKDLIGFWLPQIPDHVLEQVRQMKLPPLPPLE
jgi:integrase